MKFLIFSSIVLMPISSRVLGPISIVAMKTKTEIDGVVENVHLIIMCENVLKVTGGISNSQVEVMANEGGIDADVRNSVTHTR